MNNQQIFDTVNTALLEGNISEYCKLLRTLYEKTGCNCFFREQDMAIYRNQMDFIERLKDEPNDFYLNLTKGFIYLSNENEQKAFAYLSQAIEIDHTSDFAFFLRADIDKEINPFIENDARKAVALAPQARNYFLLGLIFRDSKNRATLQSEEIECYDNAIRLKNNFTCAYNNRACAKFYSEDYAGAMEDISKAIELNPSKINYHETREIIAKKLKDYELATKNSMKDYIGVIADTSKAIEINPNDEEAYVLRAYAKFKLEDYSGALEDYNKAFELVPDVTVIDRFIYGEKAYCEYMLKDYKKATEDFLKAIETTPDDVMAYINLSKIKIDMGDYDAGILYGKKALEIDSKFDDDFRERFNNSLDNLSNSLEKLKQIYKEDDETERDDDIPFS